MNVVLGVEEGVGVPLSVPLLVGVTEGEPVPVGEGVNEEVVDCVEVKVVLCVEEVVKVPVSLPLPLRVGVTVGVPAGEVVAEEPLEGVPDGVSLPLAGTNVEELLVVCVAVKEPEEERVPEGEPDTERVLETVADGV